MALALCALSPPAVMALDLGEIEIHSALGQPLEALIPVTASGPEELHGLRARVAEPAAYQQLGLQHSLVVDHTRAQLVERDGRTYIELRSTTSAREPMVAVLVDAITLNGIVVRRAYHLFLDPPSPVAQGKSRAAAAAPASPAPSAAVAAAPQTRGAPAPRREPAAKPTPPAAAPPAPEAPVVAVAPAESAAAPATAVVTTEVSAEPAAETPPPQPSLSPAPTPAAAAAPQDAAGVRPLWVLRLVLWLTVIVVVSFVSFWASRLYHASAARRREQEREREQAFLAAFGKDGAAQGEPAGGAARPAMGNYDDEQTQAEAPLETHPMQARDFYNEVAQLLRKELSDNPRRNDLRYKLLEVYFASDQQNEFIDETNRYLEQLSGRADEHWPKVVEMGRQLIPDSDLYSDIPMLIVKAPPAKIRQRFYEYCDPAKLAVRQEELGRLWGQVVADPEFQKTFDDYIRDALRRPTPLRRVEKLAVGGAVLLRKHEDERQPGEEYMLNAFGQTLLASRLGKTSVITGAENGWHGIAVATAAKHLGLRCIIHISEKDQAAGKNVVDDIQALGALVITERQARVKITRQVRNGEYADVRVRALNEWLDDPVQSFYLSGLKAGPAPYPNIVNYFQAQAGRELHAQMLESTQRLADAVVVGTADGAVAVGILQSFLGDGSVKLHCVEQPAVAGHVGFAREHSWFRAAGVVSYATVTDDDAKSAIQEAEMAEGWMLDAAGGQVLAHALRVARELKPEQIVAVILPKKAEADFQPGEGWTQVARAGELG